MIKFSTGVIYAHRNEEVVNVGVPQKRKRSETKEQVCSFVNRKKLTSNSVIVTQDQPVQEEAIIKVSPGEAQEARVGINGEKSRQQEEPPKFEEMDATSKWFLSESGFLPAKFYD